MPHRLTTIFALLLSLSLFSSLSQAEIIKIGVLSDENFRTSIKQWSTTSKYLKQQLPQHVFQVLPYSLQADILTDLRKNKLDFVISRETELSALLADFSLQPVLHMEKNHVEWILAHNQNLTDTLNYLVTHALLQQPASRQTGPGNSQWALLGNTNIQLSTTQQLKQVYNQSISLATGALNQHWTLLVAALLSAILILIYRKWDRHNTRLTEINKHRQQPRDPKLSDTVF